MQNLGNININIKDASIGGGGNGSPGGGPQPRMPQQQQGMNIGFDRLLASLKTVTQSFGELGDFARGPTIGGMLQMLSASSATGSAIRSLGAASSVLLPVTAGLLAIVGGMSIGLGLLSASADMTARKITEVGRFSGEVAFASANERLAQFARTISDAEENGSKYARAQYFATAASDAQAEVMRGFNGAIAEASVIWSKLSIAFFRLLKPVSDLVGFLVTDFPNALQMMSATTDSTILKYIADLLLGIYNWVFGINQNTKPQPQTGRSVNRWYINDLEALIGRGKY